MGARVTTRRVRLGRDARVVAERPDGVELEGLVRLAPGRFVELLPPRPQAGTGESRRAVVWSWSVARLGRYGAIYRGECRWAPLAGEPG